MAVELLTRILIAVLIAGVGIGTDNIVNMIVLRRASRRIQGLENLQAGVHGILFFTTPTCAPCKIVQQPAIQRVKDKYNDGVQVIEIDASQRSALADYWGVLSVPTTFIIDRKSQPRHINHGVTRAEKLIRQIENITD